MGGAVAETWKGIYPITSFVLEALGRQPAEGLSARERLLWRVAGFWAAAARGELPQYLGNDPRRALREVRRALSALGAVRTAALVRVAMDCVGAGQHPVRVQAALLRLEESLSRSEDNIDELLARYAGSVDHQVLPAATS
jgi:hypothetical protein